MVVGREEVTTTNFFSPAPSGTREGEQSGSVTEAYTGQMGLSYRLMYLHSCGIAQLQALDVPISSCFDSPAVVVP